MSRGIYKCRVEYRWSFINVAWDFYTSVGVYICSAGFSGDFIIFGGDLDWLRREIQQGQRSSDHSAERR